VRWQRAVLGGILLSTTVAAGLPPYRMEMTPEEGPVDPVVAARYTPALKVCQARAATTDDNARCFAAEYGRQDAVLNAAWKRAYGRQPASRKVALLADQRRWIAARDPFCRKVEAGFAGGTIMALIWFDCRAEQAIRRTLWLEQLAGG